MGLFSFMQPRRSLGMLLLGVWLLVTGLRVFVNIPIDSLDRILAGLALAAGALIILNR